MQQLFEAYKFHPQVKQVKLLIPIYADFKDEGVYAILRSDKKSANRIFNKINFIARQFINPLILFVFLMRQKKSLVLLNDFEQTTAFFWVPLFKLFLSKHTFTVFLHDPDRDAYPPNYTYSAWNMKKIMSLVKLALYHDWLPEKSYYPQRRDLIYLKVPHGIYPPTHPDPDLLQKLQTIKTNNNANHQTRQLQIHKYTNTQINISILGNIRSEKNYHLAIQALVHFPQLHLIIAGSPANSSVNVDEFKKLAKELQVDHQITWIEKFLSEAEFSAVIEASDIILLYYSQSFNSQSGILNSIAPFNKQFIASNHPSPLAKVASEHQIGILTEPDDLQALIKAIEESLHAGANLKGWDSYKKEACWEKQVNMVVDTVEFLNC